MDVTAGHLNLHSQGPYRLECKLRCVNGRVLLRVDLITRSVIAKWKELVWVGLSAAVEALTSAFLQGTVGSDCP